MIAKFHNAQKCTLENVDCWIGVIYMDETNRFGMRDLSPEFDTQAEVVKWCRSELRKRGATDPENIIDTTTQEAGR
ncbi:hypothetical protein LCGC14_0259020 [marine sediment metagenome]|uniref:Uncharacterized protein n=1 Tax=marine sediment metagenome TaxID=412755 RepID=A0A0F9UJB3_9ZZZZ